MDLTEELKDKTDKDKPPVLPKPCVEYPSGNEMDHIIPQMIVTPADDIIVEDQDANETSKSEEQPSEVSSDVCVEKETVKNASVEIVEEKSTPSVEDQPFETKNKEENVLHDKDKTKSLESVSHSISQRPLLIDSDRSASHSTVYESSVVESTDVSVPESITITTMQRPLIINDPHVQTETSSLTQKCEAVEAVAANVIEEEPSASDSKNIPEHELESSDIVMQPCPSKENFSYRDLDERDELIQEVDLNANFQIAEKAKSTQEKKDNLQNVKKFFGSLLPESQSDKVKSVEENIPSSVPVIKKQTKDEKHSIKNFFSPSKTVPSLKDKNICSDNELDTTDSKDHQKESKYSIKKMFDSFKQDSNEQNLKSDDKIKVEKSHTEKKEEDGKLQHKDSKSGIKKFFYSFKHADSTTLPKEVPSEDTDKDICIRVPVTFPQEGKVLKTSEEIKKAADANISGMQSVSNENKESDASKQKEHLSSMKKLLDSFKHEKPDAIKIDTEKSKSDVPIKKNIVKKSHSFKESLLSSHSKNREIVKEPDGKKNVKKFLDSFNLDIHISSKIPKEQKKNEVKRSQSCKETNVATSEGSHGFRNFLDSLTHKKVSNQSSSKDNCDHIYDVVEKTTLPPIASTTADIKQPPSKKVKDEHKEDQSGVKKLFDSFRHKDSDTKPKTIETPKKVRMNDDIQYSSETQSIAGSSGTNLERETALKTKKTGFDHLSKPKEATKSIMKSDKTTPTVQVSEPKNFNDTKVSMLNTFSDNISALKDKIFQPKEEKKSKIITEEKRENIKTGEYDLQGAASVVNSDEVAGTYKPLKDPYFDNDNKQNVNSIPESPNSSFVNQSCSVSANLPQETHSAKDDKAPNIDKTPNIPDKTPNIPDKTPKSQKAPDSLYDTCCFKLAVLFSNKAIEMVSDKSSKTPPKKPPKPSAEAIAQARAKVVSQRLKEMCRRGQSIGENIPVGYDGIRFADDETESSCDYKDVDNFDYIMDYELINRYKFDNKLETFSDPSTCSGSYYTADTVTLKDETFSDAAMENVSLGSNESYKFSLASSTAAISDTKTKPQMSSHVSSVQKTSYSLDKVTRPCDLQKLKNKIITTKKKVPPPLPPKPILSPKPKHDQKQSAVSQTDDKTSVSQNINGLSLSPRLKSKLPKDANATKSRPLVVAGLKETEFVGLQTKSKESGKQHKDRKFDTVLKNESLNKISTISAHQPLSATKSSPGVLDSLTGERSNPKKSLPERPPPPVLHLEDKKAKQPKVPPQVPEKPKLETVSIATVNKSIIKIVDKNSLDKNRPISPPRPPLPPSKKCISPPSRPPPPILELQSPVNSSSSSFIPIQDDSTCSIDSSVSPEHKTPVSSKISEESLPSTSYQIPSDSFISNEYENCPESKTMEQIDHNILSSEVNSATSASLTDMGYKEPSDSKVKATDENLLIPKSDTSSCDLTEVPKPPPRNRRVRSRTVEIVKVKEVPEQNLRRSHSLSDLDIQQRLGFLNTPEKADLKHLYTSVNKNGKKPAVSLSQSSSLEKLSGRPLPAPPPPPRKFRSLDRKPKEKKSDLKTSESVIENGDLTKEIISELNIHPPVRKKKTEQHRFHSLGHDRSRLRSELDSPIENSNIARSQSVPFKPERRHKHSNIEYDENANFAIPVEAEVHRSDIILDNCGNEIQNTNIPKLDAVDSLYAEDSAVKITPNPRRKKEKNTKGHSSWYDKNQDSEDFEVVSWTPSNEAESRFVINTKSPPKRRRSDPGKGARRTSKFYVDVLSDSGLLPLVDKETSPLPLDCSEKSVQTSLETLSQGMTSRDENDEGDDTDELLDLAQTLQNELKVIINRHKSTSDVANDSSSSHTPVLSGTDTEDKNQEANLGAKLKKFPSMRSSNSELWPLTSSEESDNESLPKGPVSLTEIAVKRKQKKIFYIAQEIMTSEEVFVDTLKLLNVDFKAAVEAANQQKGMNVVPDEVLSQILNHLPQLQHLNENLLMELKDRIDNWDKVEKIADIIVKMGPFLKLYSWYIHDFEYNVSLLEESKKKYPLFAQVVKDFESSARCRRLALNHYMLKPIQRIPQYRLLLQEYFHHLPEEHVDYQDTVTALQIVSEVATHANDSMKHGDNAQKLISIQNSIMGHKEIIKPGRLFIKEGELMKLSRKGMQPRWFVLFNDLLLYLTPVQQGLYRVNHELPLTGMKVAIPIQQDYQNEFSIISVARSFTLAARSPEERQEWIVVLTKAIEENASKRSTFTNIRLQQRSQEKTSEYDEGEFILGRKAPVWIPDARVTMCQLCTSEFTVTFRRHHCRACGKVVCSICSSNRISLPYLGNRIARVCDDCHLKLGPGSSTCTESAETDSDNQQIAVKPHLRTENKHIKKGKRNLPSVLKEVCANDQGSTISGYLQKKSGKSWRRDWFVVKDKVLYEYKASEDVAALKSLPLLGYQIESFTEAYENIDPSLLFQLTHPGQAPIVFHADSVGSTERWIAALKEASVLE